MPILPGRRLGPYEILCAIGAGGMGEVYKARDTRLDRTVAIKVLPTHLADRADLPERFEREAKTIASLNHPHICVLHDIGQQDDVDYLVMEYLEGETLAQRLQKGSLPLEQVLQYAIEISDALDKAHRKGITHRDLKPSNIMITKSGTKLLDFGLAKLKQEAGPANVPLSDLPTGNDQLTAQGAIVGTLQYMAPEQLEGNEVDSRTDIFAFGAVVYEMATSGKAFEGKTSASVVAKILEVDPPSMASLQPMTPPALDRVVKKCLAKEPERRWQAASDVCDEMKWIAAGSEQIAAPTIKTVGRAHWLRLWALVAGVALLVLAAIAGLSISGRKPAPSAPVSRSVFSLPAGDQLAALNQPAVAFSPDGNFLVYVAIHSSVQQLYLRSMNSFEAKPIPGTEAASAPFFSPDGQWVGFYVEGALKKVAITGGAAVTIAEVGGATTGSAAWGTNDMIVFQNTTIGSLLSVPAAGGVPQRLSTMNAKKGEVTSRWPEFLPGAKAVLYAGAESTSDFGNSNLAVYTLNTRALQPLIASGTRPRYAPTGHLIFGQGGTLMAAPFDGQHIAVAGAPIPIVEGVMQFGSSGVAQYSLSDNGSLAYISGGNQASQRALVWVNREGGEQPLALRTGEFGNPRISPDGRRVVLNDQGQVWIFDLARETLTRLTFETSGNLNPSWTIDGKLIVFQAGSPSNLFRQAADGSGKPGRLRTSEYRDAPSSWSPDGQVLAFSETSPATGMDIWTLRPSDQKAQPFLQTRFNEGAPRFSPDGRWLAYVSDESGRWEIYVQLIQGPVENGKYPRMEGVSRSGIGMAGNCSIATVTK
jgi:Tol biopolymer transport system component